MNLPARDPDFWDFAREETRKNAVRVNRPKPLLADTPDPPANKRWVQGAWEPYAAGFDWREWRCKCWLVPAGEVVTLPAPSLPTQQDLEALGFSVMPFDFHTDGVCNATLPSDWILRAGRDLRSYLVDGNDRERGTVFYSHQGEVKTPVSLDLYTRFRTDWDYSGFFAITGRCVVHDRTHPDNRPFSGPTEQDVTKWLDWHFPKWRDPSAYWDDDEETHT